MRSRMREKYRKGEKLLSLVHMKTFDHLYISFFFCKKKKRKIFIRK